MRVQQIGCRHGKSSKVETAVSAVCCGNGFLKDDNQQKEDDCQKKLVVKDKKILSYEVRVLPSEDTLYGTWFMFRLENGTDHELALLVLEKRVLKSRQGVVMVPVDVPLVNESLVTKEDAKEAMTRIQKQIREVEVAIEDASHSLIAKHDVVEAVESATKLKIDHDGKLYFEHSSEM